MNDEARASEDLSELGGGDVPLAGPARRQPRRRRSKAGKVWAAVAVVVVVLAVSGFFVYSALGKDKSTTKYVTQQTSTGTLRVVVDGSGTTESNSSTAVDPGVSGTVTELDVRLGSQVKKGQVLFVIDNPDLDASVQQAKSQYLQAQSSVTKASQQKSQAYTQITTSVQQAKSQYLQAQSQTAKAAQQLIAAKAELNQLKAKQASNPASVTAAQLEMAQENYNAAAASYEAAQVSEDAAYTSYKNAKSQAQQSYNAAVESYNAAVSAQKSAQMSYDQAVETAAKRTVTAPTDGYVTELTVKNGDQLAGTSGSAKSTAATNAGTTTSSSTPIVITDLSDLIAQVQISETDRPKVKVGQKVEVTFDALEDVTITGKVTEIDAVGTSNSGVVTYGVTVEFDVQDARLKPAMTASASIVTAVYNDVVLCPNAAIKSGTSGSYVQVLSDPNGTPQTVAVTTGAVGDSQTVIDSGLKGGESVVTQTITAGSSSSASSELEQPTVRWRVHDGRRRTADGAVVVIVIENVTKVYDTGVGAATVALDGVSLSIEDGEFIAIMGPSGSGKSTLMNILGCLDTPTSGRYILDGEDVSQLDDDTLADIRNLRLGFVFQSFNLLPRASVLRNVMMPLAYSTFRKSERYERAAAALEDAGLSEEHWDHKSNELSGGQMQRVAIARALVTEPSLILADEPTGNLDTKTGELILQTFERLNGEGRTVVLITHEPYIAEHAKRVVHVQDGRILSDERNARPRMLARGVGIADAGDGPAAPVAFATSAGAGDVWGGGAS